MRHDSPTFGHDPSGTEERATDPTRSFIVQAPAGSGKTERLIQRYLALLATVPAPEQILAITFTRKAAAEMRRRILQALDAATGPEPTAPHELTTWRLAARALAADRAHDWSLGDNPSRLRIQTIDALCSELARQMPLLAGFGADLEVVDNADELYEEAARRCLALADERDERGRAVRTLLAHLGFRTDVLVALLARLLARRDQWLRHLRGSAVPAWRHALEQSIRHAVEQRLAWIRGLFPETSASELPPLARYAAANLRAADSSSPIVTLNDLKELPAPNADELPCWQGLATLLLAQDAWRKTVTAQQGFPPVDRNSPAQSTTRDAKRRMLKLLENLARHPLAGKALASAASLPDPRYSDAQWATLEALVALLPIAAAQLRLVFRETSRVDFPEIAAAALTALGTADDPSDLLLRLDRSVRHVLVDEFQDTSHTQLDLLERLTAGWEPHDGRTLFLVGDPMQSIYRFREADVRLFLKARREGLGSVPLEPATLTTNYRAAEPIIVWTNTSFSRAFPTAGDEQSGAVPFVPAQPAMESGRGSSANAVSLHATLLRDDTEEARTVVGIVQQARARDPQATIGILARARDHLTVVASALRAARIAFLAQDVGDLVDQPTVANLLALTRALLLPADRIAWLTVLRTPWCGLTLDDLHRLCRDAGDALCWDLLHDDARLDTLSAEGRARCLRARRVLAPVLKARGRRSLRACVESGWLALGGPACADQQAMADAGDFFTCIDELESGSTIAPPERLSEQLARRFARPDPTADGSLQLMTIHKAKGLEFDVVILPGLGREPGRDRPELLTWLEREEGLLLAPIRRQDTASDDPLYGFLQTLRNEELAHETTRLLYVAVTRARRELHLLGHAPQRAGGAHPLPRSMLQALWPAVADAFSPPPPAHVGTEGPPPSTSVPLPLQRLPLGWRPSDPAPTLPHAGTRPELQTASSLPISFRWASPLARQVGTVVHDVLRRIAREGLAQWSTQRVVACRPQIRCALAAEGVALDALDRAATRVVDTLLAALADPRGRWILGPHAEAQSELRLAGLADGVLVHVVVDRTFVDEAGTRWVIDYKTGVHEGSSLEGFLDQERDRYRDQMARYGKLLARADARPLRFGLYYPHLAGGWREW